MLSLILDKTIESIAVIEYKTSGADVNLTTESREPLRMQVWGAAAAGYTVGGREFCAPCVADG